MTSITIEDYLKQLYLEQHEAGEGQAVSTGRLAQAMSVTPGTATSMVKALAGSGLVDYEARRGVRLTPQGEQLALHVLRRHRLMEAFLVKVLGLDWSVVHEEAEMLEHAVSDRVLERIDALLGHPTADPHGDPIPGGSVHVEGPRRASLADCLLGESQRVARVTNQDPAFLRWAEREGLVPGALVTVVQRESVADAARIHVAGREPSQIGYAAAKKILVEPAAG